MPTPDEIETRERASRALRAGHAEEALSLYRTLLGNVVMFEQGVYESWLEGALSAYRLLGKKRETAYVLMALGRFGEAESLLDSAHHPIEWAFCLVRQDRRSPAANGLADAGFLALAASQREAADDHEGARTLWRKLLGQARLRSRPYETALVHAAIARAERKLGNADAAYGSVVEAIRLLEGLADDLETRGIRERAFECYSLVLLLGKEHGSFENIAEGYTNAIRVLMAEHDRYLPLQYADDYIGEAGARGEWQAAALAAQEIADYCRRMGLPFDRHYLDRAATLWTRAADAAGLAGMSPEISESSLFAALDAAATLADLPRLGKIYRALSELHVAAERRKRYADLAGSYSRAGESPPVAGGLPDHLRVPEPYPDYGTQDLIEWEIDGEPIATLALVWVGRHNVKYKRLALRGLLMSFADVEPGREVAASAELALALGNVQIYEMLRPLERLFESHHPLVRVAVMTAIGQVLNKRSFHLIRKGLTDSEGRVREEARRSLRRFKFRDGLDSLVRIYREARDQAVRETALATIADIGTVEAGMFLLDVVRDDTPEFQALAADGLASLNAAQILPHIRLEMEAAVGPGRQILRNVLQAMESTGASATS